MASGPTTLAAIASKAMQLAHRGQRLNEADTKAALVEPILEWLGWDVRDPGEVAREWRNKSKDEPVDYALRSDGVLLLLIEAKALGERLETDKGWKQLSANGLNAGFRWCVRTNGRRWILVDLCHHAQLEQKVFFDLDLTTVDTADGVTSSEAEQLLSLLARDALLSGETASRWLHYQLTIRAKAAVDAFLKQPPPSLLGLIRDNAADQELPDALLVQCLNERLLSGVVLTPGPITTPIDKTSAQPKQANSIADLLLSGAVRAGDEWQLSAKGVAATATVNADGTLLVDGTKYKSPSGAGKALTGWTSCDGWRMWRYRTPDGKMRSVQELREGARAQADAALSPQASSSPPKATSTPLSDRLRGKPQSEELFEALRKAVEAEVGTFSVHANAKHIVFSNRSAFMAISVLSGSLRFGLRLSETEAANHSRLKTQPKGVFEGWSALHVSDTVASATQIDEELMRLIKKAYLAAS